ncbi:MAG: winged helix-turn-helix transcriptional regulator [Methyloceanibacter sp.]
MRHKSFGNMECPVARSLERVGEWWSILILRDALQGLTRFDEFQESLDIAPNMLTRRLNGLVEAGILERRRYNERPPRDEYLLTERGRDFRPVLLALLAWGNKHFAPEGASVLLIDAKTGAIAVPTMVDQTSGRPLLAGDFKLIAGHTASEGLRERVRRRNASADQESQLVEDSASPASRIGAKHQGDKHQGEEQHE